MPLIVWAHPRRFAVVAKGGLDSFYAIDYATRVASELDADLVSVHSPHLEKRFGVPPQYATDFSSQEAMNAVVRSANRTMVLLAASEHSDETLLERLWEAMEAGATGLTLTGNVWQRTHDESTRLSAQIQTLLAKYGNTS